MRTDLDHLPDRKRRDLERIVQILFAEFEEATALATQKWKKEGRILKVILYGSYARGDWVEDPVGGYYSDYDILVVVNDKRLTDPVEYWAKADDHFLREVTISKRISAPVTFIVHSLTEVNDHLTHGRPFFIDAIEQGIALYEADDSELATPKPKTPQQALEAAREYFEEHFPSAGEFFDNFKFNLEKGRRNNAAFQLHQATERLYQGVLLTLTFYTPYNHNIAFLRSLAEGLDRRLYGIWPDSNRRERAMFQKLKEAYTKARYSRHYRISEEELTWLGERVEELGRVVHQVCSDRIAELEKAAAED